MIYVFKNEFSIKFWLSKNLIFKYNSPLFHIMRELQNSIWGQIRAFSAGFRFFVNRLWPIGYVDLRKTKPTKKSSNLASKASFAIPS